MIQSDMLRAMTFWQALSPQGGKFTPSSPHGLKGAAAGTSASSEIPPIESRNPVGARAVNQNRHTDSQQ